MKPSSCSPGLPRRRVIAVRRRLLISGRVQGVFFRDGVRRAADEAGVNGSARNLPDGRVEVYLEGDEDAVERVVAWCREGPSGAEVDRVDVEEKPSTGETSLSTD